MKIGNNGNLVLGPFNESTPCLMIVLMNGQTKLRINQLTAIKSVAILENQSRPPRRNKEKFRQLAEFERGRIIVLREGGFSYRTTGAHVQRNSSTVLRVWKQWTDEHRTTPKTGSGRRKVTSVRDDRHLLHKAVNVRTVSSRQLAKRWSTATDESRFNLWNHDGRIHVRRYDGERCLPECVIERHSGLTPGVMFWGAISYHGRSNLQRIEGNLNNNRYVHEVLQPEVVPFLQGIPGAILQHAYMLQKLFETSVQPNTSNFFLGLLIRRIYRLLSTCEIWLDGVPLMIRVLQLQKTNFCCAYKQSGILFHKQIF
ncbi:transposable element Tc1 transposase [Trichonephila clavipes]|nr:transposable element Tc1 transposase [Trichonephila clavipes]